MGESPQPSAPTPSIRSAMTADARRPLRQPLGRAHDIGCADDRRRQAGGTGWRLLRFGRTPWRRLRRGRNNPQRGQGIGPPWRRLFAPRAPDPRFLGDVSGLVDHPMVAALEACEINAHRSHSINRGLDGHQHWESECPRPGWGTPPRRTRQPVEMEVAAVRNLALTGGIQLGALH